MSPLVASYRMEFMPHACATKDVGALVGSFVQGLTEDQEARIRALIALAYDKGHSDGLVDAAPGSCDFDDC